MLEVELIKYPLRRNTPSHMHKSIQPTISYGDFEKLMLLSFDLWPRYCFEAPAEHAYEVLQGFLSNLIRPTGISRRHHHFTVVRFDL